MPSKAEHPDPRRFGIGYHIRNGKKWATVTGVPGWEQFEISFQWHTRDSEPVVTALHLDPVTPGDVRDLAAHGLQTLPVNAIARAVANWSWERYTEAMESMTVDGEENDPRALTTVREFAAAWLDAYQDGKAPLRHARTTLRLSESTAERYARKARALGLIPETKRSRAHGGRTTERSEESE